MVFFLLVFVIIPSQAFAHGGRLDAQGGHNNRKTGEYHFHQGPQASQPTASKQEATASPVGDGQKSGERVSRTAAMPDKRLIGVASVIDGDTIEIHGQRIRLHGIDAPESKQLCDRDGKPWRCGVEAANRISEKIGQWSVTCDERDKDRYGRVVSVCSAGGQDLNAWMVSEGLAVAYRKYSADYVGQEEEAKAGHLGLWDSNFIMPWDWRKGKR